MKKYLIALICMTATLAGAELRVLTVNNGVISATNIAGNAYRLDYGGGCVEDWDWLTGGTHCNNNWTPQDGRTISGTHTDIGTFTVSGVIFIDESAKIYANNIIVDAGSTIKTFGYLGGGGGGGGGGCWWKYDGAGNRKNNPGDGGDSAAANGNAGASGTAYDTRSSPSSAKGGSGGTGGLGNGPYGGIGGAGGAAGNFDLINKNGGGGSQGWSGGYNEAADKNATSTGNALEPKNQTLYVGSGGGGGGGGGGGSGIRAGGGGGASSGGMGGGAIYLYATSSIVINGDINSNGQKGPFAAANGSSPQVVSGGLNPYDSWHYANNDGGDGDPSIKTWVGMGFKSGGSGASGIGSSANGGNGSSGLAGSGGGILLHSPSITIDAAATLECKNSFGQYTSGGKANAGSIKIFYGSTYVNNGTLQSLRLYEYNDL